MKKLFLTMCLMPVVAMVIAQNTGKVTYEEKVKLDIRIDDTDAKMMEGIPKEHTSQKELYFTQDASLYQNSKNKKASVSTETEPEDGPRMIIKMDEPKDQVYCDLKNNKRVEQRDFMTRMFLIESDLSQMQWKLTGNQKRILNYSCQEAVLQDTSKKVVVWFTPAIPVSTGPNGYSNLPGLVLSADIDNGKRAITATNIDLKDFDQSILVKPKEGKKVTREAFNKIVDEKRKEMQEENGGKGDVIIKIQH